MLNTIEQKLSAIKAINNAKDEVERGITALQSIGLDPRIKVSLEWTLGDKGYSLVIPENVKEEIFNVVKASLLESKEQLMESASNLMK